jgi:hypothetical protein
VLGLGLAVFGELNQPVGRLFVVNAERQMPTLLRAFPQG